MASKASVAGPVKFNVLCVNWCVCVNWLDCPSISIHVTAWPLRYDIDSGTLRDLPAYQQLQAVSLSVVEALELLGNDRECDKAEGKLEEPTKQKHMTLM